MHRSSAWLALWSIAAAAHAQVDPPAEPPPAGTGTQPSQSSGNGLQFRVPPILWNGSLGFDLGYNRIDGEPTRTYQLVTVTAGAASYVYAPWLATVTGSLSLTKGVTRFNDAASSSEVNDFATGNLRMTLFPRSRFPTELRYDVSDTRLDSSLGGSVDYRSTVFGVNQQYRPANGAFTVGANYERRTQDGLSFGRDTQDQLLIDFATSWKRQQLNANFLKTHNRAEATGDETDFTSLYARHSYFGETSLTVDSGASLTHSDDQLRSLSRTVTVMQAGSVAIWNSPTMPLTATGSVRALSFQREGSADANTFAIGAGANYEFTRNARLGGSLTAVRFNEQTSITTNGQLSATYQADTRKFGEFEWTWNTGGGLSGQQTQGRAVAALSGQIGHSLARVWPLGEMSNFSASLGQSFGAAAEHHTGTVGDELFGDRLSRAVVQTLSFNWTGSEQGKTALGRLQLSDARQLDQEQSRFQQVNFQLSGTRELSRTRRWNADLTVQYTTQSSLVLERLPASANSSRPTRIAVGTLNQTSQTASGEVAWYEDRVFNVPRLNFSSRFRVSLTGQKQSDQLVPLPDRDLASWENRLDYRVGRLESSVVIRVSRVDERQQVFAMWRLQRSFGG